MSQLADPIRICLGMSKIDSDLHSGPSSLRCTRNTETGRFKLLRNTDPHPWERDLAGKWSEKKVLAWAPEIPGANCELAGSHLEGQVCVYTTHPVHYQYTSCTHFSLTSSFTLGSCFLHCA
jgi:hypothetical protein